MDGTRLLTRAVGRAGATLVALGLVMPGAGCDGSSSGVSATKDPTQGTQGGTGGGSDPTNTAVHFIGRVDLRDATAPRCAWTYCGLSTRVSGAGLDVAIGGAAGIRYQVVIDGAPATSFESTAAPATYHVAEGLPAGDHDVTVVRASEALFGDSELLGVVPAAGAALVPFPPLSSRRMEVIGDSITAGYGNEGCPFGVATENGYMSYAAIAARALGADVHIEAQSGAGMYRNRDGTTAGVMPTLYPLTLPGDPTAVWDFSQWTPDVVVVNLGTNDFMLGNPGQPFIDAYVSFVRSLRSRYPGALILCAGDGNVEMAAALDQVVTAVADAKVERFDFTVPDWTGCNDHPSVAADETMAAQLAARLQAEVGW